MNQGGRLTLYSGKRGIVPSRKRLHLWPAAAIPFVQEYKSDDQRGGPSGAEKEQFLVLGSCRGIPCLWRRGGRTLLCVAAGHPPDRRWTTRQRRLQSHSGDGRCLRRRKSDCQALPIKTDGALESLALLAAGKADLAVGRGDLDMPAEAQTVAVLRKNFVVLWAPSGPAGKYSKRKPASRIKEVGDLAGRRVGVIGRTAVNAGLLRVVLSASGVEANKVVVTHFGTDQIEELARDPTLDAFMAVGPLDSKITSDAVAATARVRGEPKFLAIETSEAIALKHPRYESEEIPPSVFNADPAWPGDKVETVSVSHLIVARKSLPETIVAAFFRQLFSVRQAIARQVPGAAHIMKPDVDKDTELPVHRGAAAVIDGNERTFLDRYGDYFWFGLLLLSGIGSAAAWLRRYLNRDEREETTSHRKRILAMVSSARTAGSNQELLLLQREADAIVGETLECYDDGAIEEDELAAFALVLGLLSNAIAERRAALQRAKVESVRGAATAPRG